MLKTYMKLNSKLDQYRVGPWWAVLKVLGVAFAAFCFVSGFIMNAVPMAIDIGHYISVDIFAPAWRWLTEEPNTGRAMLVSLQLTFMATLLYVLRHHLALAVVLVAIWGAAAWRWIGPREKTTPALKPAQNTDIVAG